MEMKYKIIIWWSKEDGCFLAEVPELPGCMADGRSLQEVTAAIEESMRLWIEVNQQRGLEISIPKGRLLYAWPAKKGFAPGKARPRTRKQNGTGARFF